MRAARHQFYRLEGHTPVPILDDDIIRRGVWGDDFGVHVAKDEVGDVKVSTVFLSVNHNFFGDGPPILFETMIFGGAA